MADKTKSIKEATDQELDELIRRLRKESEVQSIISDIKRKSSSGYVPYDYGQEISTEKAIESLYHYGKMGMKWGHRNAKSSPTSSSRSSSKSKSANRSKVDKMIKKLSKKIKLKTKTTKTKAIEDAKTKHSEDHTKQQILRKKKISEMSNAELQSFNNRSNLEKTYRDATKKQKSEFRKSAEKILKGAAEEQAKAYVNKYLGIGVGKLEAKLLAQRAARLAAGR